MAEKFCNKCQQWKITSEFYKHSRHKDGLSSICKLCTNNAIKQYRQTEKGAMVGKEARRRYKKSEKGKVVNRRYLEGEKGRENSRRGSLKFRNSVRGQEYRKAYKSDPKTKDAQKQYYIEHPNQARARGAISNAVAAGKLPKASSLTCDRCGNQAAHYHHWSYEPEHWLDVTPLCIPCHAIADKEMVR